MTCLLIPKHSCGEYIKISKEWLVLEDLFVPVDYCPKCGVYIHGWDGINIESEDLNKLESMLKILHSKGIDYFNTRITA